MCELANACMMQELAACMCTVLASSSTRTRTSLAASPTACGWSGGTWRRAATILRKLGGGVDRRRHGGQGQRRGGVNKKAMTRGEPTARVDILIGEEEIGLFDRRGRRGHLFTMFSVALRRLHVSLGAGAQQIFGGGHEQV